MQSNETKQLFALAYAALWPVDGRRLSDEYY
jgi:hypothetical protein